MPYGEYKPPSNAPVVQLQAADRTPTQYDFSNNTVHPPLRATSATTTTSANSFLNTVAHYTDVGIFRDTLLPTFGINVTLAAVAYTAGRSLDRVSAKDWVWPTAPIINAWWSAVGRKVFQQGLPLSTALGTLSWPERLLLTGVTVWGGRLFYHISSSTMASKTDDKRYDQYKAKEGPDFWNTALFKFFLPEALITTLIQLPFNAPFRHQGGPMTGYSPVVQAMAVGLFGTGLALEALADSQLREHKQSGKTGILKEGVWSIVRHPNYLGDILIHFSIPLLLFGSDMFRPIELLGPLANYYFLRYIGGDAENEAAAAERYGKEDTAKLQQLEDYRAAKGSVWPKVEEVGNQWTWVVLGAGAGLVVVEEVVRSLLH